MERPSFLSPTFFKTYFWLETGVCHPSSQFPRQISLPPSPPVQQPRNVNGLDLVSPPSKDESGRYGRTEGLTPFPLSRLRRIDSITDGCGGERGAVQVGRDIPSPPKPVSNLHVAFLKPWPRQWPSGIPGGGGGDPLLLLYRTKTRMAIIITAADADPEWSSYHNYLSATTPSNAAASISLPLPSFPPFLA